METRASYLIVGSFVIIAMTGLLVAALWITGARVDQQTVLYDIRFAGAVAGLKPGNPVQYRGIPVGLVVDMRIDPRNVELVLVTIEVDADTPIRTDTVATLALQGITGVAFVQLSGGSQDAAVLVATPGRDRPVIASRPSQLAQLFESAPELLQRAIAVIELTEKILGPENQRSIAGTLKNVERLTGALADSSGDVEVIFAETAAIARELRGVATNANILLADLRTSAGNISGDTRIVLSDVKKAVAGMAVVSAELAKFLEESREPLTNFSNNGLYEFSQLLAESRVLVSALSRLTAQFERDPARFLFGDQQQGVELK
ncbi:MAG: MlaD family protein [Alphaproteobacteria bacterium]